jgi:predicted AAA+ superfamily ATPase
MLKVGESMGNFVLRSNYLNKLKEFKEKNLIKVITGVRRSGKSVLMEQFQTELLNTGIKPKQIISLNFEKLENEELLDYKKLHTYIIERLNKNIWTYIFLDEIQMVESFQKTVDSLHTKQKVDLYITGSNSHLLSGELATLLAGRYIQIHVLPLSFKEYVMAQIVPPSAMIKQLPESVGKPLLENMSRETLVATGNLPGYFADYIKRGSFPQTLELETQKSIYDYLDSVYNAVVVKDILARGKTVQENILTSITKFIFHNIGNEVSSVNIANTLKSNKRGVSYNTVEKYLGYLKESFIIYEAPRYDVKGKQHLKSNAKYYAVDTGLRNMLLANKETDVGHLLENIIYLELLRREYKVSVGKVDTKEVDFVCENEKGTIYIQVAATVLDPKTLSRELEPLNNIKNHFPKYLITLDDYTAGITHNGIQVKNAIHFLLENMGV